MTFVFNFFFLGAGQLNDFCEHMTEDLWCCKAARQPDFEDPNFMILPDTRVSTTPCMAQQLKPQTGLFFFPFKIKMEITIRPKCKNQKN